MQSILIDITPAHLRCGCTSCLFVDNQIGHRKTPKKKKKPPTPSVGAAALPDKETPYKFGVKTPRLLVYIEVEETWFSWMSKIIRRIIRGSS
jgi:hypothetical protein